MSYNEKVDIFALGLILCEMYCKISTMHEKFDILTQLKANNHLPEGLNRDFLLEGEIIKLLVQRDPSLRPSADELLNHSFTIRYEKLIENKLVLPRLRDESPQRFNEGHNLEIISEEKMS